jgi:hypothetical protein
MDALEGNMEPRQLRDDMPFVCGIVCTVMNITLLRVMRGYGNSGMILI